MQRQAFKMKLKPGFNEEYKKRHDEIWPELEQILSEAGIQDYSIFLDEETLTLFVIKELEAAALLSRTDYSLILCYKQRGVLRSLKL